MRNGRQLKSGDHIRGQVLQTMYGQIDLIGEQRPLEFLRKHAGAADIIDLDPIRRIAPCRDRHQLHLDAGRGQLVGDPLGLPAGQLCSIEFPDEAVTYFSCSVQRKDPRPGPRGRLFLSFWRRWQGPIAASFRPATECRGHAIPSARATTATATKLAPARRSSLAASLTVAPVVMMSSTNSNLAPGKSACRAARNAPRTFARCFDGVRLACGAVRRSPREQVRGQRKSQEVAETFGNRLGTVHASPYSPRPVHRNRNDSVQSMAAGVPARTSPEIETVKRPVSAGLGCLMRSMADRRKPS